MVHHIGVEEGGNLDLVGAVESLAAGGLDQAMEEGQFWLGWGQMLVVQVASDHILQVHEIPLVVLDLVLLPFDMVAAEVLEEHHGVDPFHFVQGVLEEHRVVGPFHLVVQDLQHLEVDSQIA